MNVDPTGKLAISTLICLAIANLAQIALTFSMGYLESIADSNPTDSFETRHNNALKDGGKAALTEVVSSIGSSFLRKFKLSKYILAWEVFISSASSIGFGILDKDDPSEIIISTLLSAGFSTLGGVMDIEGGIFKSDSWEWMYSQINKKIGTFLEKS